MKIVDRAITDSVNEKKKNFSNENRAIEQKLLADLKRNAHIERSFENSQNSIEKKLQNDALLIVNEFRAIKLKSRSKDSKNKKNLMIRVKLKIAKFVTRDFFEFEYEMINRETIQNSSQNENRDRDRDRENSESRKDLENRKERNRVENRENSKNREEREKQIASLIIAQKLKIFNDE